ncbi:sigma-54 dependent transcriptional regulator [Qipengyuania sp. 1XM1-15A]|uniref:sigma-54-dependent transcriptional regulator n=1 Tax=Qipengyuania xiamenensis TaxID=2867237 RepID=UPI001C876D0F|nr:sigma-54 dependent transcriptional regulator [Qipengyuania xiamenensis]MBX7532237.1 sigma-54 dependent transcriptional regulator [Qipengyuania xiamenensis]
MATEETRVLLLIDDEPAQSRIVSTLAAREGWRSLTVESCEAALEALAGPEGHEIDAVLLDQRVAGDAACDFIRGIKAERAEIAVLMLTASTSPLLAVEAMRAGALDYLIKPVAPERLLSALRTASRVQTPRDELQPLAEKLPSVLEFDAMVGTDTHFRTALAKAATAARGHGHVLVEGESGTGKEMLLRAIQHASTRSKAPVQLVNCAGVAMQTLESLLFGHEKGAFAGAFNRQEGYFQQCDGGTILLDEIDQVDPVIQDRLADILDTGIVRPTGAAHGFKIDIRVLAASDMPLANEVEEGRFSKALYQQISDTRIVLPPLRERAGDIPALTRYFLSKIGELEGFSHHSIADSGLSLLEAFDWPGNVRQLQTVLFRACVHEQREALTAHSFPHLSELLGDADRGESRARGLGVLLYQNDGNLRPLEEIEADIIRLAIGHYQGKMTEVARRLGIGRSTLYRKLSDLGIDNAA